MSHSRKAFLLAVMLALPLPGAHAQATTEWAEVEGWSVRVDNTVGYGCYIHAQYESGTSLRLGYDPQADNIYLMIGNPAWRSIEQEDKYNLLLQFDNLPPWKIEATGVPIDDRNALAFELSDSDFAREFMERHVLKIAYRNSEIDRLTLSGSLEAVNEMIRCQNQVEQAQGPDDGRKQGRPDTPKDSLGSTPRRDPFF